MGRPPPPRIRHSTDRGAAAPASGTRAPPAGAATPEWLKQLARAGDVEGVLIVTADPIRFEDVAHLELVGFPYVLLNRRVPGRAVWCVVLDDYGIGRQAVDYLYALGHRSLAHLAGPPGWTTAADRLRGVLDGLRARGLAGASLEEMDGREGLRDAPVAFGSQARCRQVAAHLTEADAILRRHAPSGPRPRRPDV